MSQTAHQLGLTEELVAVPINVDGEMWTLLETARYLYEARRSNDTNPQQTLLIAVELNRVCEEAEEIGDTDLVGATEALEESARETFIQTALDSHQDGCLPPPAEDYQTATRRAQ